MNNTPSQNDSKNLLNFIQQKNTSNIEKEKENQIRKRKGDMARERE